MTDTCSVALLIIMEVNYMAQMNKGGRTGRRRWSSLVRFLTEQMKTSGSERVRMAAAFRLADILTLREQREIAELRAAARAEAVSVPVTDPEPSETDELPEQPDNSSIVFTEILSRGKPNVSA